MRRLAPAAAVLAAALALPACGGSPSLLADTADKLSDIRSGILGFRFEISSRGALQGSVGYSLSGPFALPEAGKLPVARLRFTKTVGDTESTALFVSTGEQAFIGVGGKVYEMPEAQSAGLRAPSDGDSGANPLADLGIDDWFRDERESDGGRVGGAETTRIHGALQLANAVNDLLDLAGQMGASDLAAVPRFEGDSAESLDRAVRSATMDVFTGTEDHLLRRMAIHVVFGVSPAPGLGAAFGNLQGADVRLELDVTDPNRPVHVAEPAGALPASALPTGS